MPFGIPGPGDHSELLADTIASNAAHINAVGGQVGAPVLQTIASNQQSLDSVHSAVKSQLQTQIQTGQSLLHPAGIIAPVVKDVAPKFVPEPGSTGIGGAPSGPLITHAPGTAADPFPTELIGKIVCGEPGIGQVAWDGIGPIPPGCAPPTGAHHGTVFGPYNPPPPEAPSAPAIFPHVPSAAYTPLTCKPAIFPVPGSPEWCAGYQGVIDAVVSFGNELLQRVVDSGKCLDVDLAPAVGALDAIPAVAKVVFAPLIAALGQLIQWGRVQCLIDELRNHIRSWRDALTCIGGCDMATLLPLAAVRALIRALHNVRLGTDALVWATMDIDVVLIPVEVTLDYLIHQACPVEIPQPGEAIECYLMGTASEDQVRCWLEMRGVIWDQALQVIQSRREKLQPHELIQWLRRNDAPREQQISALRNVGYINPGEASARVDLYDELPSIADHLHWLQRNVFDDKYVADYQLLDGFETRFWTKFGHDLEAQGYTKQRAAFEYAAHWIQPSPEQMKQLIYRSDEIKAATGTGFTITDYQRILTEQDYSVLARGWFAATAYQVPAISYVRGMYAQRVIGADDLRTYHRRLGYTPEDADRFARIDEIQTKRQRATQSHGWNPAALAKAFIGGRYTADEITQGMASLGYTEDESIGMMERAKTDWQYSVMVRSRSRIMSGVLTQLRGALRVGTVSVNDAAVSLTQAGWPEQTAIGLAQLADADARSQVVRHAVIRIRHALISGEIDTGYARSAIDLLGIVPAARERYIATWAIENTPQRKRRTAREIVKDVSENDMSTEEAIQRLHNLGYNDADSLLYLADSKRAILQRGTRADAARAKGQRQEAAELRRLQRETERQKKALLRQERAAEPPSTLRRWARLGVIDSDYFGQRMTHYGYTKEDIDRYWAEAMAHKSAVAHLRAPKIKEASVAQLKKWAKAGVIDQEAFAAGLDDLSIAADDRQRYIDEAYPPAQ